MRVLRAKLGLLLAFVILASLSPSSAVPVVATGQGPALASIGPLTFGPDGTLFAADNQGAAIFALDLGAQVNGGVAGAKALDALDEKLAALLGTGAREVSVTDLAVHPRTRNAYVSVMRGQGAGAAPALFRIDGAGQIANVSLQTVKFQKVELPNAPVANAAARQNPRTQVVTDMAFADGRLWVAGLSNEEFASKLRAIPYPFATVDRGVSVEIYHGNHKAVETRSPVNAFVPYTINNQQHLIAGYTCTPLVKFPIADLKAGDKVRGTTIAEFGAGNRVLDMIVYKQRRTGIPAHREQQPRRDEDSHGAVRVRQADHGAGRIRDGGRAVREGRQHDGRRAARQAGRHDGDRHLAQRFRRPQSPDRAAALAARAFSIAAPRGGDRLDRHRRGVRPFRRSPVQLRRSSSRARRAAAPTLRSRDCRRTRSAPSPRRR